MHLHEVKGAPYPNFAAYNAHSYLPVDAVMLTGATSKEEQNRIYQRLQAMANGTPGTPEIKLCYVTVRDVVLSPQRG